MPTQRKIETVQNLSEKLKQAKTLVLTDYRGLTHRQLEDLRKVLREHGADFTVVKNTLLRRALEGGRWKVEGGKYLTGPTALLLSSQDDPAPLKEIAKFIRLFQLPTLKVGIIEDRLLTGEELLTLAQLPSKEVLLGQLTWQMKVPLYGLQKVLSWNIQKFIIGLKLIEKTKPA